MLAKNYDIKAVYEAYDRNHDELISPKEFTKLFNKIEPELAPIEIDSCFRYFDENSDGSITFDEFRMGIDNIKHFE